MINARAYDVPLLEDAGSAGIVLVILPVPVSVRSKLARLAAIG